MTAQPIPVMETVSSPALSSGAQPVVVGQGMGRGSGESTATIPTLLVQHLQVELRWISDCGGCQPQLNADAQAGSQVTQLSRLP